MNWPSEPKKMDKILLRRTKAFPVDSIHVLRSKAMNVILREVLYHFDMFPVGGFPHSMKNNQWQQSSQSHYEFQMIVTLNVRSWRGHRFMGIVSCVMSPRCCFVDLPELQKEITCGSFSRLTMS